MKVTIDLIDELRSRVNISYEEAKKVLEKNDGDIIKSIVEIENSKNIKYNRRRRNGKINNLLIKLLNIKFEIKNKYSSTILRVPLVLVIFVVLFEFWISVALMFCAIFTSCKFKVFSANDEYKDSYYSDRYDFKSRKGDKKCSKSNVKNDNTEEHMKNKYKDSKDRFNEDDEIIIE